MKTFLRAGPVVASALIPLLALSLNAACEKKTSPPSAPPSAPPSEGQTQPAKDIITLMVEAPVKVKVETQPDFYLCGIALQGWKIWSVTGTDTDVPTTTADLYHSGYLLWSLDGFRRLSWDEVGQEQIRHLKDPEARESPVESLLRKMGPRYYWTQTEYGHTGSGPPSGVTVFCLVENYTSAGGVVVASPQFQKAKVEDPEREALKSYLRQLRRALAYHYLVHRRPARGRSDLIALLGSESRAWDVPTTASYLERLIETHTIEEI